MKKRNLFITAIVLFVFVTGVISYALVNNLGSEVGTIFKQYRVDKEKNNSKILAILDDNIKINQSDVDYQKQLFKAGGIEKNDNEIVSKIIGDKLMHREALNAGVTIDDDVIKKSMNDIKVNMPKDVEGYKQFNDFISSSGWTEDEYWENSFSVYKNAYIIGKYKQDFLYPQFIENNKDLSNSEIMEKFNEYYEQYRKQLISASDIKYLN